MPTRGETGLPEATETGPLDRLLRSAVSGCWLLLCLLAFVSLPWRILNDRSWVLWPIGIASVSLLAWLSGRVPEGWIGACRTLLRFPALPWAAIAGGVALRVAWVAAVRPVQVSDADEYVKLAERLLATGEYWTGTAAGSRWYAYRAPGYTFFLAGWMWLLGKSAYLPAVTNILAYVGTSLAMLHLGTRLINRAAAVLAVSMLAIWPCNIGYTGIAAYEMQLMFLGILTAIWTIRSAEGDSGRRLWNAALAGVANGVTVLIRPTALIMPALWLLYHIRGGRLRRSGVLAVAVATLFTGLVIAPWTIRNYRLGIPVLVSGTGSSALLLAANGYVGFDYEERALDELVRKVGFNEARFYEEAPKASRAWIRENTWRYLRQNAERMICFLGEDTAGFYWSLSAPLNIKGRVYVLLQAVSQVWWIGVWVLAFVGAYRGRRLFEAGDGVRLLAWTVLAYTAVSFPFFNVARYHIPLAPMMLLVGSLVVADRPGDSPLR